MKTPEQIDEEFECQKCHASVQLGDGLIPTKYCNLCAQELVESMSDRLQVVEAENKSRRKEIASLDEQLIEAKRAIETQYNLRQAAEAERDRCKRLLESFKAFVSVTPVNPLNTWLEERDKLISNSECRVCSTCGGLLGSHYAGTPCSCIQALQPAQKEQS